MQGSTNTTTSATSGPSGPTQDDYKRNSSFAVTAGGAVAFTPATKDLLASIGGVDGILAVTTTFYEKFHSDRHIRQFLGGLQQPLEVHAGRLGKYIAEQMGAPSEPWTTDTQCREMKRIRLANGMSAVVRDRFSAHHCAWHSVDRPADKVGRRFKLDDCRVWMRLFFWSLRECGHHGKSPLFRYMQKFIAHFIAVYEQTARQFAVAESEWSADEGNIKAYESAEHFMIDVVDVPLSLARKSLKTTEREIERWLYDDAPVV